MDDIINIRLSTEFVQFLKEFVFKTYTALKWHLILSTSYLYIKMQHLTIQCIIVIQLLQEHPRTELNSYVFPRLLGHSGQHFP